MSEDTPRDARKIYIVTKGSGCFLPSLVVCKKFLRTESPLEGASTDE